MTRWTLYWQLASTLGLVGAVAVWWIPVVPFVLLTIALVGLVVA